MLCVCDSVHNTIYVKDNSNEQMKVRSMILKRLSSAQARLVFLWRLIILD